MGNRSPQNSHLNGLSSVWRVTCSLKDPRCVKFLPHTPQLNGFSPVCVVLCQIRCSLLANVFPHNSHLCGLLAVPIVKSFSVRLSPVPLSDPHKTFPIFMAHRSITQ